MSPNKKRKIQTENQFVFYLSLDKAIFHLKVENQIMINNTSSSKYNGHIRDEKKMLK